MNRGMSWLAVVATAVVVWTASTGLNLAQPAKDPCCGTKVAVVDLVEVFNEFDQTKVLGQQMGELTARLSQEADRRVEEIKAAAEQLKATNPDTPDWNKRNRELKLMKLNFGVWKEIERETLEGDHLRWTKRTYQTLTDEVARVAQAKGYDLVITREVLETDIPGMKMDILRQQIFNRKVVYSASEVDLTQEVLLNLNAAFEKAGGAASVDPSK